MCCRLIGSLEIGDFGVGMCVMVFGRREVGRSGCVDLGVRALGV